MTTVQQNQPLIIIEPQQSPIVVDQNFPGIVLQQGLNEIEIQQFIGPSITIQGGQIVANTIPFQAIATQNNQTQFNISYTFSSIVCLFIMGVGQNILGSDYTINGDVVTLSQGVPSGYVIFGAGQI